MTFEEKLTFIKNSINNMKSNLGLPLSTNLSSTGAEVADVKDLIDSIINDPSLSLGIYKVASIAERDNLNAVEGDICLVYNTAILPVTGDSVFNTFEIKQEVRLGSAPSQYWANANFESTVSGTECSVSFYMDRDMIQLSGYHYTGTDTNDYFDVQYTTSDSVLWTVSNQEGNMIDENNIVTLTVPVKYMSFNEGETLDDIVGYFIQVEAPNMDGLYYYNGTSWEYLDIGKKITSDSNLIYGSTGYTSTGSVEGTLMAPGYEGSTVHKLNELLSGINSYVESMSNASGMFEGLEIVNFDNLPLNYVNLEASSNLTDTSRMFMNCYMLNTTIPNINTTNVTNMCNMFYRCDTLNALPNIDMSNAVDISNCFCLCERVTTFPVFNFISVENACNCFMDCKGLRSIPSLNMPNCRDASYMFSATWNITGNQSSANIYMPNVENIDGMFCACYATYFPNFDTSNITSMSNMFGICYYVKSVPNYDTSNVTNMDGVFRDCPNLTSFPNWDTSNVVSMARILEGSHLTSIPNINYENVINMFNSFAGMSRITAIGDLTFNSVENISCAFQHCYSNLKNVGNLTIPNAIDISSLYSGDNGITSIGNITAPRAERLLSVFSGCSNLTTIPEYYFPNATNAFRMFYYCPNLSNASISNILKMCVNMPNIENKTLTDMGFNSTSHAASKIQAQEGYSDFINAGWTIGY